MSKIETSSKSKCGFCNTGHHERCAVGIRHEGPHAKYPKGIVWVCNCTTGPCEPGRRKCAVCGNRNTEEVNPDNWQCFDLDTCNSVVQERRANNPFLAQLTEIKETVKMAKIEDDKNKAEKAKAEKPETFCLVTGEPTKGGLFKPGMDARYVSERVAEIENAEFSNKSIEAGRARVKKDGVSEKLAAKFEKSLGLAQARAEKRAQAKVEKEQAKAEKEQAKAETAKAEAEKASA